MPSKAEEIFERALELPEARRTEFVGRMCGDDSTLRTRVLQLLDAHVAQSGFLPDEDTDEHSDASSLAGELPCDALVDRIGHTIDRYKLLEKLGEGGFGTVWAAEQLEPVRRRVAIKIVKPGMDTKQVIARFEAERQALAMMDHPNIAKFFDAGTTEVGRPYFVMELIRGVPITRYCDQKKLTTEERIDLFIDTCNAVQHAHQKGIIHRDIKPSNVLVTLHDGIPIPKVIDFGIAKATQHPLTEKTVYTQLQHFVGTPAYMSPEQMEMSGLDIDTRSDVYSLGILLYELLTGQTPFDSKELLAVGLDEMRRVIREQEPPRPSLKVSTLTGMDQSTATTNRRIPNVPKLASKLEGDLDWIVLKCLEKDRTRRYETANGLADDLLRHVQDEPVSAQPPSTLYRLQKTWRRNRVAMTAGAVVAIALLMATGVSVWQAARATRAKTDSERSLYAANMSLIRNAWEANRINRVRQLLEETADQPEIGFEWYFWQQQLRQDERTLRGHLANVDAVLFSPDSKTLFSAGRDNAVRIWSVETGDELDVLSEHEGYVTAIELSADGKTLYVGDWADKLYVWDWQDHRLLFEPMEHVGDVRTLSLSKTGILAVGTSKAVNYLYDLSQPTQRPRLMWSEGQQGNAVGISPDGTKLISSSFNQDQMRMLDVETQAELSRFQLRSPAIRVRFSPNGERIMSTHLDQTVSLWDLSGNELLSTGRHLRGYIGGQAFAPDGQTFATSSDDNTVKIWSSANGALTRTLRGHAGPVRGVAYSPDGQWIATASHDGSVKLWDAPNEPGMISVPQRLLLRCMDLASDGKRFVTGGEDQTAVIQSLDGGEAAIRLEGHKDWLWAVAFSPDAQRVVTGSGDGTAMLWSASTGQLLNTFRHGERVVSVAFSRDGRRVVTGGWDGRVAIWNTGDATKPIQAWPAHEGPVWAIAHSPSGQQLASGAEDHAVRIWDANNGRPLATLGELGGAVRSVDWCTTANGQSLIAAASVDSIASVWDAGSRSLIASLTGHSDPLWCIRFSPDGRRVATASGETGQIRVWSSENGHEMLLIDNLPKGLIAADFTSDNRSLVAASPNRQVRAFRTPSPAELAATQQEEALTIARVESNKYVPKEKRSGDAWQPRLQAPTLTEGTVNAWLVLSPIRLFGASTRERLGEGMATPFIPEVQLTMEVDRLPRSAAPISIGTRELAWRSFETGDGIVDFNSLLGEGTWWDYCIAYAVSYVYSPRRQPVRLVMRDGSDATHVYLNGALVYVDVGSQKTVSDSIELEEGRNVLMLKTGNSIGPWSVSLRFTDPTMNSLRGLRFSVDPEADFTE